MVAAALGFSLLAGIAVGMALRAVAKIMMIIAGIIIAALMFLQFNGWIHADWESVAASFNTGLEASIPAFDSFLTFVGEQLPKAALFSAGFYWAIRRPQ